LRQLTTLPALKSHSSSPGYFTTLKYWYDVTKAKNRSGVVVYAGDEEWDFKAGRVVSWRNVDKVVQISS